MRRILVLERTALTYEKLKSFTIANKKLLIV